MVIGKSIEWLSKDKPVKTKILGKSINLETINTDEDQIVKINKSGGIIDRLKNKFNG